jgi:hypothetical protein
VAAKAELLRSDKAMLSGSSFFMTEVRDEGWKFLCSMEAGRLAAVFEAWAQNSHLLFRLMVNDGTRGRRRPSACRDENHLTATADGAYQSPPPS